MEIVRQLHLNQRGIYMSKRIAISLRLTMLIAALLVSLWLIPPQQVVAWIAALDPSASTAASVQSSLSWSSSGAIVTQTFNLDGGWNTIYLEVEPINPSPLVNEGSSANPLWLHQRSTVEAVFAQLDGCACLESVWTWNLPSTRMDFIVDPAEGLWDEPGWRRYVPAGKPDAFLTDLASLHTNTGYLVQLKEGSSATLSVSGRPVVRKHRWVQDSYNLAGFPILAGSEPTRQLFFASSSIDQVYRLSAAGEWVQLAANARLASGEAYLIYYNAANIDDATDFTAPFIVQEVVSEGLNFGVASHRQGFTLHNLSAIEAPVSISLVEGGNADVALQLSFPVIQPLRDGPGTVTLLPESVQPLKFSVLSSEQAQDGEALLQISAPALGVRWLLPVTAKATSRAGLWIGEVTVTEVSEGRLGSTNVESNQLTISLHPRSESGIRGAVEIEQNGDDLALAITLALPGAVSTTALDQSQIRGEGPTVGGYVFWDANQNGVRDNNEAGLAGRTVTLEDLSTTTAADGSYRFTGLAPGSYAIEIDPPPNYSASFDVTLPVTPVLTMANLHPALLLVSEAGIDAITPAGYVRQALLESDTLPYYDEDDNRVEPAINFGFVPVYSAQLVYTGRGGCADVVANPAPVALGEAINGTLAATVEQRSLRALLEASYAILISAGDEAVACGEIREAVPTLDPFRFRLLLRVQDENARPELLPYYEIMTDTRRISSVIFSMLTPKTTTGGTFRAGGLQRFEPITEAENDPLNPYRHKYHPDHDNLDTLFRPLPAHLDPHRWESVAFTRRIQMTLVDDLRQLPGLETLSDAEVEELVIQVDWGGVAWGGFYKEVISGIHKNTITVQGTFMIRQVLRGDELRSQPYD
jgi:hypothetical protein